MSRLTQPLSQAAQWYNQRPLRERALILVTLVVLVLLGGWELAVAPVLTQSARLDNQMPQAQQQVADLEARRVQLSAQAQEDPNAALEARLASRQRRLADLQSELALRTDQLIEPRAMVALLRDMLATRDNLTLERLELLAPEPIYGNQDEDGEERTPLLYAHDVELTIAGGYLDLLAYLQRLEALDQRLGWNRLIYEVTEYPRGEARVRVRTLGLRRAWLGV